MPEDGSRGFRGVGALFRNEGIFLRFTAGRGLTKGNKLTNIWARGRKKRRGTFKTALPKNKKVPLNIGCCGCRLRMQAVLTEHSPRNVYAASPASASVVMGCGFLFGCCDAG